jgi:hypothetical protein
MPAVEGSPLQKDHSVGIWLVANKIGHGPHEFPSVFSWFLPDFIPGNVPIAAAKLVSPETQLLTMPNMLGMLNGMISMTKYGGSDCNGGFMKNPGYGLCSDDGLYKRSIGRLSYDPPGDNINDYILDLALLLTAGRLSDENGDKIATACSSKQGAAMISCITQLLITTAEFHSTNTVQQTGQARANDTTGSPSSTEPYKAIVYLFLDGAMDSYNMLAPYTCGPIDVYDRYRIARGKNDVSAGVGLPLNRLLDIDATTSFGQPCSSFGIHENLPILRDLYRDNDLNFVAGYLQNL